MAKSRAKKKFLASLPSDIKARLGKPFRLPPAVPIYIYDSFSVWRSHHRCNDVRDYITQLAIIGLEEVRNGRINLTDNYEFRKKVKCNSIAIDFREIDEDKLREFSTYIDEYSLISIKDVISAAIVAGFAISPQRAVCRKSENMPIYS